MSIQSDDDGYWSTDAILTQRDKRPFGRFIVEVSAAGRHGEYAGVLIRVDGHATIAETRQLAADLLAHADIAEAQAISEVAFSSEMVAGALS